METKKYTPDPRLMARFKVYGPWAVVTGASDGVGRQLAELLAARGLHLLLVARREAVLEELAADLSARYGIQTQVMSADLSQPSAFEQITEATRDLEIGLLVACAGFGSSGTFIEANLNQELNMLDLNCRAVLGMLAQHERCVRITAGAGMIGTHTMPGSDYPQPRITFAGVPACLASNWQIQKRFL